MVGEPLGEPIRGSTTIEALLRRYPDGRAIDLMRRLGWPCPQCNARRVEPLALAAKRHRRDVRAVIACFRALDQGGPSEQQVARASDVRDARPDPTAAWLRTARQTRAGG